MNKYWKAAIAAAALLSLSISLASCGKNGENKPTTQTESQTQVTEPGGSIPGTQGTEATTTPGEENTDTGSGRPTISGDTEIGSGREEGQAPAPNTQPTTGDTDADAGLRMNYQQYMALSNAAQQKFYDEHFANDPLGFASWFQKIKAEYDEGNQEVIATGPIDLEDYIKP